MNHVFVDYENVREIDLAVFGVERVSVTLLVGANEKKLAVDLVEQLFAHAASVQFVRLTSSGKNALDMTLAYYLGRAAATEPATHFYIVSKDKDFDPLQKHLQSRGLSVRRCPDFASLPFLQSAPAKPKPVAAKAKVVKAPVKVPASKKVSAKPPKVDEIAGLLEHLRTHPKQRPRTRKRLVPFVINQLGQTLSEAEAAKRVAAMEKAGGLAIGEKGRVSYSFEEGFG